MSSHLSAEFVSSRSEFPSYAGAESRFETWEGVSVLVKGTLDGDIIREATNTVTCGCPCSNTSATHCGC